MRRTTQSFVVLVVLVLAIVLVGLVVTRLAPMGPSPGSGSCGVPECFAIQALSGTWNSTTGTVVYSIPAASMSAQEPFNVTYVGPGTSPDDCVHVFVGLNDSVASGAWRVELATSPSVCPGQSVTIQALFHIDDLANPGGTIVGDRATFIVVPNYNSNLYAGSSQVVWGGLAAVHVAFQASA